ncbi:cyclic-di-AMP receptor [Candidatus Proelusimicrobium excrementi]|uniref:cyclic-di-AMP receptor n=1 Tax=Candidatus Proelusimicrobium excrementi TaxID=3416222 RepID=UPI003C99C7C3|nr:cyclic-di-AMP receptor [Elusimicrobiaceae bacterium]
MLFIIAIIQDEDASRLINELMTEGYRVTKLATTGGFLRAGNTTLLVGVDDERFQAAMDIIEKVCKSRKQIAPSPSSMVGMPGSYTPYPIEVVVGGATIFVLSVDQFVKL